MRKRCILSLLLPLYRCRVASFIFFPVIIVEMHRKIGRNVESIVLILMVISII